MRSKFLLAGGAVGAVLTVAAVIAAAQEWWWLVVGCAMVLLTAALVVALDADRRVRSLRPYIRDEVTRGGPAAPAQVAPPVSEVDVIGAVRVLQAQYTGRLDRMQAALDEAVALVRAEQSGTRPAGPEDDRA